jgi:hypothetical protein
MRMTALHRNRTMIPATQAVVPQVLLRQTRRRAEMPATMGVVELALERDKLAGDKLGPRW